MNQKIALDQTSFREFESLGHKRVFNTFQDPRYQDCDVLGADGLHESNDLIALACVIWQ